MNPIMLLCRPYYRLILNRSWRRSFSTARTGNDDVVRIVEVGPRDGLQNEKATIALKTKIELIHRLAMTGLRDIEAGSFVAPKWVPQMANSAEVLTNILENPPPSRAPITYNFLVPNLKGLEKFLETKSEPKAPLPRFTPSLIARGTEPPGFRNTQNLYQVSSETSVTDKEHHTLASAPAITAEVSVFTAATESFCKVNLNCTISESLERCRRIVSHARCNDIRVRGYVSVALGCPYEGPLVSPIRVTEIVSTLFEMGVDEVSIGDTTGMGQKPSIQELFKSLKSAGIASKDLALHFHDTYGQALVNTTLGIEYGIRTFDSSVGGLGGCPYAKGATGNVATEDLVYLLHSLGAKTGIDLIDMVQIGAWVSAELGRVNESRVGKAILARQSSD